MQDSTQRINNVIDRLLQYFPDCKDEAAVMRCARKWLIMILSSSACMALFSLYLAFVTSNSNNQLFASSMLWMSIVTAVCGVIGIPCAAWEAMQSAKGTIGRGLSETLIIGSCTLLFICFCCVLATLLFAAAMLLIGMGVWPS